jgi:hypothetical protein
VCFQAQPSEALLAELGDRRGWLLYRELVRDRLRKELHFALPRTRRAAGEAAFERVFEQHLDRDPPRTRFFREVVLEFVKSAVPAFRADAALPPWLADLALYEGARWEVSDLDARLDESAGAVQEFAFERAPVLSPALRLLALAHPVHEAPQAKGRYEARASYVCVHRSADADKPRTWTLNHSTYALLSMWQADPALSVTAGVHALSRERGTVVDATFVDGLCGVLAEFIEAGILLGSRAGSP